MIVPTDVSVRVVSACPFVCSFLFRLSERETEPKRKDPAGHSQPYPSTVETGLRNSLRSNSPRLFPSLVAAVLNGLFIKWRKKTHPRPLRKGGEIVIPTERSDERSKKVQVERKRFFLPLVVRMTEWKTIPIDETSYHPTQKQWVARPFSFVPHLLFLRHRGVVQKPNGMTFPPNSL